MPYGRFMLMIRHMLAAPLRQIAVPPRGLGRKGPATCSATDEMRDRAPYGRKDAETQMPRTVRADGARRSRWYVTSGLPRAVVTHRAKRPRYWDAYPSAAHR